MRSRVLKDGTYDKDIPSCEPVRCPVLTVVDGAVLPEGRPKAGEKVFVNCEIGWILVGPEKAYCQNDGTYDVYQLGPCVKATFNRCPLTQPLNGYTIPYLPSVAEGTFVQIYCNESYQLIGNNHVRCTDIGVFDYALGTCIKPTNKTQIHPKLSYSPSGPERIPSLKNKTHCVEYLSDFRRDGKIVPSGQIRVGEEIRLNCEEGYLIVGNQTSECMPNGTYSHILGVCANVTCPAIVPHLGRITPPGRVLEDQVIELSCDAGHVVIGLNISRCLKGGFYNDTIGECKRVCQPPDIPFSDVQTYQPIKIGIFGTP